MEICNCTVRLRGRIDNTVVKSDVTVPEIVILRHLHGNDAVVDLTSIRMNKRPHSEELLRLRGTYGGKTVSEVFPGAMPKLPIKLTDIGFTANGEMEPEPNEADYDPAEAKA